jgi:hypothetical protein
MFPSSSSSAGMLRRMLIESTEVNSPHMKCADDEQSLTGHHVEQIDCQLDEIQGHGRIDGVEWNSVIADAMLSTSASPRTASQIGFNQPRVVSNMSALTNDSDSDTPQELQLSSNELDDEAEDDDGDNVLSMGMDQDSTGMCRSGCNMKVQAALVA